MCGKTITIDLYKIKCRYEVYRVSLLNVATLAINVKKMEKLQMMEFNSITGAYKWQE